MIEDTSKIESSEERVGVTVSSAPTVSPAEKETFAETKSHTLPIVTFGGGFILLAVTVLDRSSLAKVDAAFLMQALISCAVTAASLFVILAKRYSPKDKNWAYATVGTIIGFWLHVK